MVPWRGAKQPQGWFQGQREAAQAFGAQLARPQCQLLLLLVFHCQLCPSKASRGEGVVERSLIMG